MNVVGMERKMPMERIKMKTLKMGIMGKMKVMKKTLVIVMIMKAVNFMKRKQKVIKKISQKVMERKHSVMMIRMI